MKLEEYKVYFSFPDARILWWRFSNTKGPVKVDVYRSQSPEELEKIAENVEEPFYYDMVPVSDRFVNFYYKIVAKDDISQVESEPTLLPFPPHPIAKSVVKMERHYLEKFIKRRANYYIRKRYGERCIYCWDEIKMRTVKENCENCYGTGFVGGYYKPIGIYIQIMPLVRASVLSPIGETKPDETQAWMSNFPLATPGDLIVEVDLGYRWRVVASTPFVFQGYITRQDLRLSLIDVDAIEYKLDRRTEP